MSTEAALAVTLFVASVIFLLISLRVLAKAKCACHDARAAVASLHPEVLLDRRHEAIGRIVEERRSSVA